MPPALPGEFAFAASGTCLVYRSGAAWAHGMTALAVGPTGSDISRDGGRTWRRFDTGSFDAVECTSTGGCWASGEQGRMARLR